MRFFLKQNILEIFPTIYEAHININTLIEKKDYEGARIILGDCQNAAVRIGTAIEQSEGEGFVTVGYLEDYCEAVYEAAENISDESSGNKVRKQLDKQLIKAENSAKSDINVKLEIVFFPYKSSMWDSLESVWKAADADPDCNARVIPIPYYDKKPDGSLGEMHYEGADFPEYVPIIHYEAYNLELMKPDVIYIHNPYDNSNYATSVEPGFYTTKLKKYTDNLVYIPYFVVSDGVPDYLCAVPGCFFADKVFLQSKMIRDKYAEIFVRVCGSNAGNPEDKFIAYGSPKFDSIFNAEQNKPYLPPEWSNIISGKKVVLYNTSVSAILRGNVQYLKKICSVLQYFSEHRDVVLWWRPHPLSVAVYSSMRSELLDIYRDITERYKKSQIGIYDDTADLQRALVYSDGYYGDRSSLVALYQFTGKPVMIQNPDVCEYDSDKISLDFEDIFDDGQNLIFTAMHFNGLFKMNKETMQPELIGFFPDENPVGERLYSGIAEHNGKLYFTPMSAKEIGVYDMTDNSFSKITYPKSDKSIADFYNIIAYENVLIFIPYMYPAIMNYDTETGKLSYCSDWVEEIRNSKYYNRDYGYFRRGVIVKDKLYLPCVCAKKMVIYDLKTQSSEVIDIMDNDGGYHGICYKDNKLWLSPLKGKSVCMEPELRKITVLETPCDGKPLEFVEICSYGDKVRMYPYDGDTIVEIDTGTETVSVVKKIENNEANSVKIYSGNYMFAKNIGESVYAYNLKTQKLAVCNPENGEKEYSMLLSERDAKAVRRQINKFLENIDTSADRPDMCNYNEGEYNISHFVEYYEGEKDNEKYVQAVQFRRELRRKTLSNPDGTAGRKIHEYMKKAVMAQ